MSSRASSRRKRRIGDRGAAVIAIAALLAVIYVTFGSLKLFSSPYTLRAEVLGAPQVRADNPVRIAGVQVGRVARVEAGKGTRSVIVMEIDDDARPIHSDAGAKIAPRLALEGNFYVDLSPGSSRSDELSSGATIALDETSTTPQLDQVVNVLDAPTRVSLQAMLEAWGTGLGARGTEPSGARGLRRATRALDGGLEQMTRVMAAFRGRTPGDLTAASRWTGDAASQLSASPDDLAGVVRNTERVGAALLSEPGALAASIERLSPVLRRAPATLDALDTAVPELKRFAIALRPGLDAGADHLPDVARLMVQLEAAATGELPPTVAAAKRLIAQLPSLERQLTDMLPFIDQAGACIRDKLVPGISQEIPDPIHRTGRPAYQDLVHGWTTLSASNPTYDANGRNLKGGAAVGERMLSTVVPGFDSLVSGLGPELLGVAPKWMGVNAVPPFEPGADCREQKIVDFSQRISTGPPQTLRDLGPISPAAKTPPKLDMKQLAKRLGRLQKRVAPRLAKAGK